MRTQCNKLIAKDEGNRFLLTGANGLGYYDDLEGVNPASLAKRFHLFAARMGLQEKSCDDCKVIGERLEINGRQYAPEIKEMLLKGEVFQHLFVKEVLIESGADVPNATSVKPRSECR